MRYELEQEPGKNATYTPVLAQPAFGTQAHQRRWSNAHSELALPTDRSGGGVFSAEVPFPKRL